MEPRTSWLQRSGRSASTARDLSMRKLSAREPPPSAPISSPSFSPTRSDSLTWRVSRSAAYLSTRRPVTPQWTRACIHACTWRRSQARMPSRHLVPPLALSLANCCLLLAPPRRFLLFQFLAHRRRRPIITSAHAGRIGGRGATSRPRQRRSAPPSSPPSSSPLRRRIASSRRALHGTTGHPRARLHSPRRVVLDRGASRSAAPPHAQIPRCAGHG